MKFPGLGVFVFRTNIPWWTVVLSIVVHAGALALINFKRVGIRADGYAPIQLRLVSANGSFFPVDGPTADVKTQNQMVVTWRSDDQAANAGRTEPVQAPAADLHQPVAANLPDKDGATYSALRNSPMAAKSGLSYFNAADYIPRAYLSVGPEPLTPVEVRPPLDISGKFDVTIELSLFIDELGRVQRLRSETPDVAPPFVEAAKMAFAGVSFKPGLLDGKPVRSLIRVAVDFVQD